MISPLVANVYLHYVFDLWADQWRKRSAKGEVIIVRFADDIVMGFEFREDAESFQEQMIERLNKFNLELNNEKTQIVEFGRHAAADRKIRGARRPETFDFLGFTFICGETQNGRFVVKRQTRRKKIRSKLVELRKTLRKRMHEKIPVIGQWLRVVLLGHYRYFGVHYNYPCMSAYRHFVSRLWYKTLRRRSQRHRMNWERMLVHINRWLPRPRIYHPYPEERLCVRT